MPHYHKHKKGSIPSTFTNASTVTFLSLALELRQQIYEELFHAETQAPSKLRFHRENHRRNLLAWPEIQKTVNNPLPSSLILQLCCRQMHREVRSFLNFWLTSHRPTYKLDVALHSCEYHLSAYWTSVPVPLKYVRRLEITVQDCGHRLLRGDMVYYSDGLFIIRAIAAFLRSGPRLSLSPRDRPIPFLDEVVIFYPHYKAGSLYASFDQLVGCVIRDLSSGPMHGFIEKIVCVPTSPPDSPDSRTEVSFYAQEAEGDKDELIYNRTISRPMYGISRDWTITWRAAYARNLARNLEIGEDRYPTGGLEELPSSEAATALQEPKESILARLRSRCAVCLRRPAPERSFSVGRYESTAEGRIP